MKRILCFCLLCLILSGAACAQTKEKAEKEVAAAVESLRKAMISGDRQQLQNITAPELVYGHSSGKVEDRTSFVETLASGKSDFVSIDLADQSITVAGNTALVRHTLSAETNDGGNPGTVKIGVLLVWQKQQGKWKLLGRQAYKI